MIPPGANCESNFIPACKHDEQLLKSSLLLLWFLPDLFAKSYSFMTSVCCVLPKVAQFASRFLGVLFFWLSRYRFLIHIISIPSPLKINSIK